MNTNTSDREQRLNQILLAYIERNNSAKPRPWANCWSTIPSLPTN